MLFEEGPYQSITTFDFPGGGGGVWIHIPPLSLSEASHVANKGKQTMSYAIMETRPNFSRPKNNVEKIQQCATFLAKIVIFLHMIVILDNSLHMHY